MIMLSHVLCFCWRPLQESTDDDDVFHRDLAFEDLELLSSAAFCCSMCCAPAGDALRSDQGSMVWLKAV